MSIVDLEESLKKELAGRKVQGMTLDDADKVPCTYHYVLKDPLASLTDFPYLMGTSVDIIYICPKDTGEHERGSGPGGGGQERLDGRRGGRQEEEEGMLCHQLRDQLSTATRKNTLQNVYIFSS